MPLARSASLHKMAARTKNKKTLSGFHRSHCWPIFNQTSQEWSVPSLVVHAATTFCLVAQNGRQSLKNRKTLSGFHRSHCWPNFNQTSQEWSVPTLVMHAAAILLGCTIWPSELKIEKKPCPAFTGQTAGPVKHFKCLRCVSIWEKGTKEMAVIISAS